jgi:hypothetical protein
MPWTRRDVIEDAVVIRLIVGMNIHAAPSRFAPRPMPARPLRFESLESRRVWAGDVTISAISGSIHIGGDGASNFISITEQVIHGKKQLVVTARPFEGKFDRAGDPMVASSAAAATTINGQSSPFITDPAGMSLDINMGGGNDAVAIDGAADLEVQVLGIRISMGTGRDYLKLDTVRSTSSSLIFIAMATGNANESGGSKVVIDGLSATQARGTIRGAAGVDDISLSNIQADGDGTDWTVDGGGGNDLISLNHDAFFNLNVYGRDGDDSATFAHSSFHDLLLYGAAGNDAFAVSD